MPVSVASTKQLLRAWLLADATLSAAVGGRVFGAHLMSSDAQTVLQAGPVVVFEFVAGVAPYVREIEQVGVEVYVYSKGSADEVAQIYDIVYLRLQAERIKVVGIGPCGTARESERPTDGWNEDVGAWFCRARWLLRAVAGPEA
jgi:hypothetical protein